MAAIPKSLSYFLTRMTGYSRNSTLMRAEGQDQARPGQTVVVNLPQGIVDLRTLAMHFKVTTTDATGLLAPKHIETIIQSIVVECGGILVDVCDNAHQIFKCLADYTTAQDKNNARLYQNGIGVPTANVATLYTNVPFTINNFMGFLGSARPECIDLSMLPSPFKVYIRLAPLQGGPWVLNKPLATAACTLTDIKFTIDVLDVGPMYSDMIARRLQEGPIEIPFQKWFTFTNGATGPAQTTRFAVSSQSVDLVAGCLLNPDYAAVTASNASNHVGDTDTSKFFSRLAPASSYFTLNSVRFPMYDADEPLQFNQTIQALGHLQQDTIGGFDPCLDDTDKYKAHFGLHVIRLNHQDEAIDQSRLVGGWDTRGTMAAGNWITTGGPNGAFPHVFVACSSTLRVGQYRQVEIVQ